MFNIYQASEVLITCLIYTKPVKRVLRFSRAAIGYLIKLGIYRLLNKMDAQPITFLVEFGQTMIVINIVIIIIIIVVVVVVVVVCHRLFADLAYSKTIIHLCVGELLLNSVCANSSKVSQTLVCGIISQKCMIYDVLSVWSWPREPLYQTYYKFHNVPLNV